MPRYSRLCHLHQNARWLPGARYVCDEDLALLSCREEGATPKLFFGREPDEGGQFSEFLTSIANPRDPLHFDRSEGFKAGKTVS